MQIVRNLGNIALMIALWAAVIVGFGGLFRVMEKLFCVGYGC